MVCPEPSMPLGNSYSPASSTGVNPGPAASIVLARERAAHRLSSPNTARMRVLSEAGAINGPVLPRNWPRRVR